MKVRIGDMIYDSKKKPIALFLDEEDKKRISRLPFEIEMYASFPKGTSENDMIVWLNEKPNQGEGI